VWEPGTTNMYYEHLIAYRRRQTNLSCVATWVGGERDPGG